MRMPVSVGPPAGSRGPKYDGTRSYERRHRGTGLARREAEVPVSDPQVPVDPESPAPPEGRSRLSRMELLGAALAVAGGCVVTLTVLNAGGGPAEKAAIAVSADAARLQLAASTAMAGDPGPGWTPNRARWVANAPRSF